MGKLKNTTLQVLPVGAGDTPSVARRRNRQGGISLVITLVVLVIITLSSVAMMATLKSGTSASSNIAFRQAATRTADVGVENALTWIAAQQSATFLAHSGNSLYRYYATHTAAAAGCTKDGSTTFSPEQYRFDDSVLGTDTYPCAFRLANTPSGYSLFYVIHRMASSVGSCTDVGCMRPAGLGCNSTNTKAGQGNEFDFESTPETYFRITVKVVGPRQNNRYVQAFVC